MKNFIRLYLVSIISVTAFIIIWEMAIYLHIVDPVYIGTPHLILVQMIGAVSSPSFISQLFNSGESFIFGYLTAVLTGVLLGLLLGLKKYAYQALVPYIFVINSLPFVALLPLLIVWFGIGVVTKGVLVYLMVLPIIVINTIDGVRTVDKKLIEMADSLEINEFSKIRNIYLPHALPSIFTAMRIGIGRGLIAVIVAEIFGLGKGIAYYIPYFGSTLQIDRLLAYILIILLINFCLTTALKLTEKRIVFWN